MIRYTVRFSYTVDSSVGPYEYSCSHVMYEQNYLDYLR